MKNKIQIEYTWSQFFKDMEKLIQAGLFYKKRIENVYPLPRGGLIPGVILSHALNVPLLLNEKEISEQTLIVDDISDTGATLRELTEINPRAPTATLWIDRDTECMPNIFFRIKEDGDWIVFPWEQQIKK